MMNKSVKCTSSLLIVIILAEVLLFLSRYAVDPSQVTVLTDHGSKSSSVLSPWLVPTDDQSNNVLKLSYYRANKYSSTVHVAMVVTDDMASIHIHNTIKSILVLRSTPLHFHFISDDRAKIVLQTIMNTWLVPSVVCDYYNLSNVWQTIRKRLENTPTQCSRTLYIHLNLELVLPESVQHVVVIEPSSVAMIDLAHLVSISLSRPDRVMTVCCKNCVQYCSYGKLDIELPVWGLIGVNLELQAKKELSLVYDMACKPHKLDNITVVDVYTNMTQVTCANILNFDGETLRYTNVSNESKLLIEPSPPTQDYCKLFDFERKGQRRELPFLLGHSYKSEGEGDVTLAVHLDCNRLDMLAKVLNNWDGPASVAIHARDSEVQGVLDFIFNSTSLRERRNVSYHLFFRFGPSYPPNHGRELAHRFVSTPYMFILDVDFIPSYGMYSLLKRKLGTNAFGNMYETVVVVPAFETKDKNFQYPATRSEMVHMFSKNTVTQFHNYFNAAHGPTNYSRWKTETEPYSITWKKDYEPYYALRSSVFTFDRRFIARFGNKASHSTQLHMAGYKFIVFPKVFVIHLPHELSEQNMGALRKCNKQWYNDWLNEKRNQYNYTKQDIRTKMES